MIIADELTPESMVLVPLDDYEDGIVARTKLILITDLVEKSSYVDDKTLRILLGIYMEEKGD